MKIAIITQFGDNYGNKLQNYALQTLLENMGHEVETIIIRGEKKLHQINSFKDTITKLRPKYISMVVSSRFKNKYPYKNQRDGIIRSVKLGKTEIPIELIKKRSLRFKVFSESNIKIANKQYLPGEYDYPDKYDAYICGSDQVWNPNFVSAGYFAQFAPKEKRVAFAPSFGVSKIPDELHSIYRKWINEIPYLSVREESGSRIIKNLTGKSVPVLPDPTLCLSPGQWEKLEKKPGFIKSDYILTYFLGNETNRYRKYIEKYAKNKHLVIIDLFDLYKPDYYPTDPSEFVWLIHNARAVFTDSFHGTVFSLIFHTPFVVFDRIESGGTSMSSRIDTLLNMVGLEDRHFRKINDVDSILFNEVDQSIHDQVEKAMVFLHDSLESISKTQFQNKKRLFVQKYKQECSGCALCANICPVNCINMVEDSEGFNYPKIESNKCINCNKCLNVCDKAKIEMSDNCYEKAYVAYSKNSIIRSTSSSGGLFGVFAELVVDNGGTVFGVGYAEDWKVIHKSANDKAGIEQLRGSKYVQSIMDHCFFEIKSKLEHDELVYFCGTPCQVDGLLAYLDKDYCNLITQDIICHGVPSPLVWREYLKYISGNKRITNISFRNKKYGWHYFSMNIVTEKAKYVKRLDEDVYTRLFLDNVTLRPSCYSCKHKHLHRKADITLADCWGDTMSLKDDDRGVSLVFINTEKGQKMWNDIQNELVFMEVPFDKASKKQDVMTKSVLYNQNHELFFSMAKDKGMKEVFSKWFGFDSISNMKRKYGYKKYKLSRIIRKRL